MIGRRRFRIPLTLINQLNMAPLTSDTLDLLLLFHETFSWMVPLLQQSHLLNISHDIPLQTLIPLLSLDHGV